MNRRCGACALLLIVFVLSFLSACDDIYQKEVVVYDSPSVRIVSANSTSFTEVQLVLELNVGAGQELQNYSLFIENITSLNDTLLQKRIVLTGDSLQRDTLCFSANEAYHDFQVYAVLTTDRYRYSTPKRVVRSPKTTFDIEVYQHNRYMGAPADIASFVNRGSSFSIKVEYSSAYMPQTVEVILNDSIRLEHTLDFENVWYGEHIETMGTVYLPATLVPGDYEVSVLIDGLEIACPRGLRVLRGVWTTIEAAYPGANNIDYNTFVKGDKLYLMGGRLYVTQITNFPVWEYDIPHNVWTRKNNFPSLANVSNSMIYPQALSYNDQAYVLLKNDSLMEVWTYLDVSDQWQYVATYPGSSSNNLSSFLVHGQVYVGGGSVLVQEATRAQGPIYENCDELWAYDLEQGLWVEKSDFPDEYASHLGNATAVSDQGMVYMMGYKNKLWQYSVVEDTWQVISQFHDYYRRIYHLVEREGQLYFFGGQENRTYLKSSQDTWSYDIDNATWELCASVPEKCAYGIVFEYDNAIYTGLNYIYSEARQVNIHRLDF